MEKLMALIKAIRNSRAEMNVPPSKKASVYIETDYPEVFREGAGFIVRLASASEVRINEQVPSEGTVQVVTSAAKAFMPLGELIDFEKERERLGKEREKLLAEIARIEGKLSNEKFVERAPAHLVEAEREKREKAAAMLVKLEESIAALGK